jgi:hypothetical protein
LAWFCPLPTTTTLLSAIYLHGGVAMKLPSFEPEVMTSRWRSVVVVWVMVVSYKPNYCEVLFLIWCSSSVGILALEPSKLALALLKTRDFIFFFKWGQKLCPIQLIKEKYTRIQECKRYYNYSPDIKSANRFASARTHNLASALIKSRTTKYGKSLWRNTLAFRSFQIFQTTSNASEANPFRCRLGPFANEDHHSCMSRPTHFLGCKP